MSDTSTLDTLRREAVVINDYDDVRPIIDMIGDASIVLLGEATHGTEEFYRIRANISKALISGKGFDAIAVEADWPDALRVSRYICGRPASSADTNAEEALQGFERFPQWMWRNTEITELVEWMHQHNTRCASEEDKVGFFGLDLYSLRSSMDAVVKYLAQVDPEAAQRARARYSCFDHLAEDPQRYGYAATFGLKKDCEEEVVRQLIALTSGGEQYLSHDGPQAADELFYAQQNARVAQNAEAYYRTMFMGRDESWNLRDTHMAETLEALRQHIIARRGHQPKIVVWAHNSHLGDARATEMGEHGQLNLGQLVREKYGTKDTFILGFTTHTGSVTAASEWDGPAELKGVRPSHLDSYERLFHNTGLGNFVLPIRDRKPVSDVLQQQRLERAIGVIYLPESERISHYFYANAARQFDAVMHVDDTHALQALERMVEWKHDQLPETYPSGI